MVCRHGAIIGFYCREKIISHRAAQLLEEIRGQTADGAGILVELLEEIRGQTADGAGILVELLEEIRGQTADGAGILFTTSCSVGSPKRPRTPLGGMLPIGSASLSTATSASTSTAMITISCRTGSLSLGATNYVAERHK